jgi:tetratricopeptide (TPR) repeat protein
VRQAIALKPNSALYHNTLGIAYGMTRAVEWAVEAFTKAASLSPQYPDPHVHLGNILRMQGRKDEAVTHLERAVAIRPNFAEAHNNLGTLLIDMEQWRKAESHPDDGGPAAAESERSPSTLPSRAGLSIQRQRSPACRMLAVNPGHPAALTDLGAIYSDLGERDRLDCLRQALAAAPGNPQIKLDLANALSHSATAARQRRSTRRLPASPRRRSAFPALIAQRRSPKRDGDFEDAAAYSNRRMRSARTRRRPGRHVEAARQERCRGAGAEGRTGSAEGRKSMTTARRCRWRSAASMRSARNSAALSKPTRPEISGGARATRSAHHYDRQARRHGVDAIIRTYDADFFTPTAAPAVRICRSSSWACPARARPCANRSLASHSDVHGADELMDISIAASRLDPANYRGRGSESKGPLRIDHQALHKEAARYIGALRSMAPDAKRVIDKLPANFENLGLIAAMFPHAKIIHCRRDPRDIALSCFTTKFLYPLVWSLDLDDFPTITPSISG